MPTRHSRCLYMSYLCDLFFIIIFIFIAIDHIITLKQIHLFFGVFQSNIQPQDVTAHLHIFCQFQPGVAYKNIAQIKSAYIKNRTQVLTLRGKCPNAEFFPVRIPSEYRKIRTRKNSVFADSSRSVIFNDLLVNVFKSLTERSKCLKYSPKIRVD